jgi:hypothetical protein
MSDLMVSVQKSEGEVKLSTAPPRRRGVKKTKPTLNSIHMEILKEFAINETQRIPKLEQAIAKGKQVEENKEKIQKLKKKKQDYFAKNAKFIFSYYENKSNIETGEGIGTELLHSHKYFENVSTENYIDLSDYVSNNTKCEECGKGENILLEEGTYICDQCSAFTHFFIENDKPMNNEEMMDESVYKYHPFNHFKEVVAQFQGKETTTLPAELLNKVRIQIKKERIKELNYHNMREILKKLSYSKYYEHIFYILKLLNVPPYYFTYEEEQKLYALFKEIQLPFTMFCPSSRVNFLNYYYILRALCMQAGITGCLTMLPGLVESEKIHEHNVIYKQIANYLGWEFHPMYV